MGLVAVCHEELGAAEYAGILGEKVYVNTTREFFGPNFRWFGLRGLFSRSLISNLISSWRHGHGASANMRGEGRLLGGLYVVGAGAHGVVYRFEEPQPGVYAPKEEVLRAVEFLKVE